jgi:hypothetical protein
MSLHFWNTNLLIDHGRVMFVFSILLLCISVLFFVRNRTVLLLYVAGLGSLLAFKQIVYFGVLRHDGHVFILFLASAWLARSYEGEAFPSTAVGRKAIQVPLSLDLAFTALLSIQVLAGLIASVIALRAPFSQARATANFLRSKHMDQMFILGDPDYAVSPIAGYLNREIYYPRGNRMGSYVIWDQTPAVRPQESVLDLGRQVATEKHQNVLVILNRLPDPSAQEIASFTGSVAADEDYYIYLVQPRFPPPDRTADSNRRGRRPGIGGTSAQNRPSKVLGEPQAERDDHEGGVGLPGGYEEGAAQDEKVVEAVDVAVGSHDAVFRTR